MAIVFVGIDLAKNVFAVHGVTPALGRGFTEGDAADGASRVVVLGDALWRTVYGGDRDVLGRAIRLDGAEYEVVGIFDSDLAWENAGIVIHADVLGRQLGRTDNYTLLFVYTASDAADRVRKAIETGLPRLRAVPPGDFTSQYADQLEVLDEFIALVTAIAIVIGVLGVLNTMMMSVSERTREIGMLRACGWPRALVIRLILLEGLLLSVVGGAIGLVLGVAGTEGLLRLFSDAFLVAAYLPSTFVKGALVAVVVGMLAALYPAYRAANLSPVEALRYE